MIDIAETYWEVYSFLMREAELLDERRERECWSRASPMTSSI